MCSVWMRNDLIMLKLIILIFTLCISLEICVGQYVQNGQCDPNIALVANFDIERFSGTWYELQRTRSPEQTADCSYFEISNTTDGIIVVHNGVSNNFEDISPGNATLVEDTARLTLNISIFDSPIDFWVILTDNYANYAVTYACENISPTQRRIHLWVLGRGRSYPTDLVQIVVANAVNDLLGIDLYSLQYIDHSETACYVLPVIEPGESIIIPGQCDPNIQVQQNFDVGAFTGTWHEISSYYSESSDGTCIRAEYSIGDGAVDVVNSQIIDQVLLSITGNATLASTDNSAKLDVILNVGPGLTVEQELWVISTDYTSYAISYSCVNLANNQRRLYSWILGRTRQLNTTTQAQVNQVIDSVVELNANYYTTTNQTAEGCFYYPEPSDQPVIFRGQCDLSIPAVANFDPVRYMGLWYNIELYPAIFQDGTCGNANYELVDGTVDVFNTQVVNETLDTIRGIAVIATDDGTGKLRVSFPIAGTDLTTTTDYWVLGTDYVNYALVYSCTNLDDDRMQVSSWKLSRRKQLDVAANNTITNLMSTIPVLDQRYYKTENQTEEGCFFYPTPEPGVPVVFPGRCEDDISMQNFDLSLFNGTWFEIQAYPKIEQPGQCTNHTYAIVSNSQLSFITSTVNDQFLSASDGNLTSSDSTGRLNITIVSGNENITIPFWIITTNYEDYALAYACVDRPNDFKAVWSWKLSRTKELSQASITAMDNAMENIVVIDNRYYETIDQSDQACFHLPEITPGEPIILPGQCNASINAIPNFNLPQFTGRWRLIGSYPYSSQSGTCNTLHIGLIDALSIYVSHTEVVDQELISNFNTAVLASTDGSGRLQFTSSTNQPSEFLILDTDYNSYALIYGCENITSSERRVWSWKLSRDVILSDTANNNINQIINQIEVLNNRYYNTVNRSEAGCFYYPEADSNTAVQFRSRCDENINAVPNFNPVLYTGLWHDIQSYPEAFQDGTCNNAYYTLVDGVVDVFNTQVINQQLDTITGVAVLASDDGSAKLNVTFNVGGINVTTNYWVLATDYVTYSFVYSCRPIDDEYVQVTSWKLSRTKELTAAANTAINNVMNNIQVLDQRYFVERDQSADGCFYFPEPQEGVPVVFPGQCDDNINTVQNFNFNQFQGDWYEIEAYPKEQQTGQCVNHTYSVIDATRLNLVSSSILNQVRLLTTAEVTGSNGKLNISIVSNGQTIYIPFWILATDYTDYALAYACVNNTADYRSVWSWKLSRSKTLSPAATTAINNIINNIDVLNNTYYEEIDQRDEACFYLPDLGPNDPVIFPGQCDPNIPVVPNFNVSGYLGRWRTIEDYHADFQFGTCSDATYSANLDGSVMVYNTEVVDRQLEFITGSAVLASTDGSGKLLVTFPTTTVQSEYWILATDYDSYALVYSCQNITNDQRRVWSWKLSRTNTLTESANTAMNQVINSINVLDNRYYRSVNRTEAGCFYYPEAESSTTVLFRGQCNENINVVPNFNAADYLGLWYDIESYPMPFQFGTCPNAYYSLGNGVVNVYNTQVVNQTLDTIHGIAEVVGEGGSAKLNVTFNVEGLYVSTNYWVLSTDYSNYAYVYSCENVDDEYMSVFSWKLSRIPSLTTASITAINTVMNTLDILDERYYVDRNQTDAGCFYYPEVEPGTPVVFRGQCDNTIAAVPNFSREQFFANVWHETASYPYIQTGDCINHQFTIEGTSFIVSTSNVANEALYINNSTVISNATDGTGRLYIEITVNGQVQTIPFWVLATDYTDYALAYGCLNVNETFRQVYSWKLSRTRVPTTAGTNAINNAITTINVLDNRYYEDVAQTDVACFYLPVLSPNEAVTFPGQCDPNIPVISNFNPTRYLGRWRLIQTYYAEFQVGTCQEATYSANADGSVLVYNTEVINQELDSITGSAVLATTDGSGKLLVTFPTTDVASEYWILDTDYDSYALVYSCQNITNDRRRVWSWKMSRNNTLTSEAETAINQVVSTVNVLNDRYYQTVNRTDNGCFYYPDPDDNTIVVFRGQCDMNIPALPNFDAGRYLGFWYDLHSYPAPFQNGTCINANYTLNDDGSVRVENTQVVNQVLETWIGSAVVSSNDGSAKLNVTFNVNGINVTSEYWVLATDYENYAYVYSCTNIDEETRSVFSWKLSRHPELTAAANTSISGIMNTINVLDERYYVQRSHSEDDCFYYPDNNGGDVILDGQCLEDNLVPVVTNFNVNSFAGTWHEVSRFPSVLQEGECAAMEYAVSGANTFTVTQTIINNERQNRSTTQATASADGRGVLTVNINGVPFNNIYILDTDYTGYALAYACRNLNTEQKQIYSWKLSKSRSGLSNAAEEIINQLVSDNIDLWEGYYRTTQQDNNGCFFYPVFDTLPYSIELPGPCDTSITGVNNFNAAAYLGRWFETARYPLMAQIGQCSRAEYSLSNVGGVDRVLVSNTEVAEQTLLTQLGYADVASTDGSGELSVEFIVDGLLLTANYYILATDYISYSLVYSCANLPNGNRTVSSWKLSRTTSLSPAASNIMDGVIANTQGLIEEYYQPTSQLDDDCFYVPFVNISQAPLFRGQCESISGVAGFDIQRYLGWWHEIERFPIDGIAGECRSSEYTQDGNTYRVVDNYVQNNEGNPLAGTVTVTNNGILRRSMPGSPDQDIYVLATDYDNYALLYSCENVGTEYRRVWSAKHSRVRSLSDAAQNAMTPVIESNRVLYPQFYLTVDQTDNTCFHYPTITIGEVIIPGQCDNNIPVVTSFNIENFAGTWFYTETYDDVGSYTCLGSRYTVDEDSGDISVIDFKINSTDHLVTLEGNVTVQSTDGSARLITITYPNDATTTVSVLATDYDSYAVAYNCANVNAFQRQVRAWKLSRNRTMSAQANSIITSLIQQRQELYQQYFNTIEQDEECEEPSSAFFIKSSIIMLFVCAMLQWLL